MGVERVIAWLGSFIGNSTMFGAIVAGWPGLPAGFPSYAPGDGMVVVEAGPFRPYIVDTQGFGWPTRLGPQCPGPLAVERVFGLAEAPLPAGFDPTAWPSEKLYACVRVDELGDVLATTLIGVRDRGLTDVLTVMIRHEWRFFPSGGLGREAGWVRVRLNSDLRPNRWLDFEP